MSWADDPVKYSNVGGVLTATWGTGGKFAPGTYQYIQGGAGPGYTDPNGMGWVPVGAVSAGVGNVSSVTGVSPLETSYSLYGHIIPLSVFGVGRIGGEIISGPVIENGLASFIISFGVPADPSGTRTLREIAFDSEVVWDSVNGFSSEAFTYRFYGGTLTQSADALETAQYGSQAVAYRPQILIAFENLPLANTKFKKIPYVAAVIADATGDDVNLGEAFERLAYSPWVGFTSSQFETTDITDGLVSGGLIFAEDTNFLDAIKLFGRFYPTWNIIQTDKLRITDRGSTVSPDIVLTGDNLTGNVVVNRQGADTVARNLELSTIDPDADYTIVPFRAVLPRDPVAVTTSVTTDTAYLPAIMDASTRAAVATFTQYHEHLTRKTVSATAMAYGLELEPGDLVQISDLGDDFSNDIFRVVETLHGVNYTVEFTAEPIMRCGTHICGWDPATTLHTTLSNSDLTATGAAPGNGGARMVPGSAQSTGKYYFELTYTPAGGTFFSGGMGIALTSASYSDVAGGIDSAVVFRIAQSNPLGSGGSIWAGGAYSGYDLGFNWAPSGVATVVGIAVDLNAHKIWFKVISTPGSKWNGPVANGNPATGVNGVTIQSGTFLPVCTFGTNSDVVTANFGASAFTGTVPSGFTSGWPC